MMFQFIQNQEKEAEAEFIQLYAKIADTLAVAGVVGQNPSALLSIQLPGVNVPPGLNPLDPQTEYYVSNLLNAAIECNYVVTAKAALTSDVYKLILDGKETPEVSLTPEEKKLLEDAKKYLSGPYQDGISAAFKAYLDRAIVYYSAQDALFYSNATYNNGGPDVPPEVKERCRQAEDDWINEGNKVAVERALATIQQLEAKDPYMYWQGLADRYALSTVKLINGSQFQRVDSFPRYAEWFKDELWTPFSFDEKDYDNQRRSGGTGMHGRSCCCYEDIGPYWAMGRPVHPDTLLTTSKAWIDHSAMLVAVDGAFHMVHMAEVGPKTVMSYKEISFSCSIKRINIVRPWMDTNVFYSRLWKWSPLSIGRGIVISTGGSVAGNVIATGVLPVLPSTALLAKDIELTISSVPVAGWIDTKLSAGMKVRYGPFLLDKIRQTDKGNYIASGSPEIFGYISTIFPKCPNPDMTLPWPT